MGQLDQESTRCRSTVAVRLHRAALWLAYRLLLAGWFIFRPRRRGVFVAVWHADRLLAIRNSYRSWLALPAGGVKRGEAPLDAAVRELREEVGIAAGRDDLRFAGKIATTFEFKRDCCAFFEVALAVRPEIRVDGREVLWAGFIGPDEALRDDRLAPPVRAYLEARKTRRSRVECDPGWNSGRG